MSRMKYLHLIVLLFFSVGIYSGEKLTVHTKTASKFYDISQIDSITFNHDTLSGAKALFGNTIWQSSRIGKPSNMVDYVTYYSFNNNKMTVFDCKTNNKAVYSYFTYGDNGEGFVKAVSDSLLNRVNFYKFKVINTDTIWIELLNCGIVASSYGSVPAGSLGNIGDSELYPIELWVKVQSPCNIK